MANQYIFKQDWNDFKQGEVISSLTLSCFWIIYLMHKGIIELKKPDKQPEKPVKRGKKK